MGNAGRWNITGNGHVVAPEPQENIPDHKFDVYSPMASCQLVRGEPWLSHGETPAESLTVQTCTTGQAIPHTRIWSGDITSSHT